MLGAAGLAVGLALQGTLSNVAAGVMLLILRPYRVGDVVDIGGAAGSVQKLDLFTTQLSNANNHKIVILLQQPSQALTEDHVVVGDQHSNLFYRIHKLSLSLTPLLKGI